MSFLADNGGARFPQDSYYGGRASSVAPNGQYDWRQQGRDGGYDQQQQYGPYAGGRGQRFSRMNSESQFTPRYAEQNVYPTAANQRSYETVASGSGSGASGGEPAGYQTDPTSSDNSSIERMQAPPKRQEPVNDYGIGFNQSPTYQPSAFTVGVNDATGPPVPQHGYNGPPVPQKDGGRGPGSVLRKEVSPPNDGRPGMGEKRKSWFSKRFSKQ